MLFSKIDKALKSLKSTFKKVFILVDNLNLLLTDAEGALDLIEVLNEFLALSDD